MKNIIHIQSEEAIRKAINRFCYTICIFSLFFMLFYVILGVYLLCILNLGVGLLFFGLAYLNKRSQSHISRIGIVISTSVLVIIFSAIIGFKSGLYMYLFAAPHLIYLLFDFKHSKAIILCFAVYLVAFLALYVIDKFSLVQTIPLPSYMLNLIYPTNVVFSLILCFILITFFANNNSRYTIMITEANGSLLVQQHQFQKEIEEKNRSNAALSKTIKEKEMLLSEIHHRVKNNLAVISGLVELQNMFVKDEKASSILKESRNRIKSIALLHEKLYENKNLDRIEIRSYVDEFIYFLKLSFSNTNKNISIHSQIDPIELAMEEAQPFSLLLNELITNSYKHAFDQKDTGNIYINLIKNKQDITFHFRDDGKGFDLKSLTKDKTLGMNLIEAFSKQLKGTMVFLSETGGGMEFKLHFKLYEPA